MANQYKFKNLLFIIGTNKALSNNITYILLLLALILGLIFYYFRLSMTIVQRVIIPLLVSALIPKLIVAYCDYFADEDIQFLSMITLNVKNKEERLKYIRLVKEEQENNGNTPLVKAFCDLESTRQEYNALERAAQSNIHNQ